MKVYVNKKKVEIKEENSKRYSFTEIKLELKKGDKYATKKSIDMLEKELEHLNTKVENPVLVVDLLRDIVVESTFSNVPRLLITYLLMPHTEEESSVISYEYRRKNVTVETIIIFELYCIGHSYSVKHIRTVSFCRYFLFRNVYLQGYTLL